MDKHWNGIEKGKNLPLVEEVKDLNKLKRRNKCRYDDVTTRQNCNETRLRLKGGERDLPGQRDEWRDDIEMNNGNKEGKIMT